MALGLARMQGRLARRYTAQQSTRARGGKGFGTKEQVKKAKKNLARLGEPTKEDLLREQATVEATYGSERQAEARDDDTIPTVVTDRMLRRVLTFAGIPVAVGLALFPLFWYLKVVKHIDLPMGFVFVTQSIVFGTGLLGISYGATSASWDPRIEGSRLGWNEFKANLSAIRGRVK